MAKYEMQETPDLRKTGKRVLYPRLVVNGQMKTDEIIRRMAQGSSFTEGDIKGILHLLAEKVADAMGEGYSVKLDEIGTFTASLAMAEGKEREDTENGVRKNAQSIVVGGVNFRADKEFVMRTGKHCRLERSEKKFFRSSQKYTAEERLQMACRYLEQHPYLTVADYAALTGLVRSTAALELRKLAHQPGTGIVISGRASHRVYVKEGTQE